MPIEWTRDTLWLEYDLLFHEGTDLTRGGYLPGLAGGLVPFGERVPKDDGFSARIWWKREDGQSARLRQNLYFPTMVMTNDFASDLWWGYPDHKSSSNMKKVSVGRWHTLRTRIILDGPHNRGGSVTSWLDNALAADSTGYRFRGAGQFHIDAFMFAVSWGGQWSSFASAADQTVSIDNIKIFTRKYSPSEILLPGEILKVNFDDDTVGVYTFARVKEAWLRPAWNSGLDEGRARIVDGARAYRGKSLEITYPAGATATAGSVQWKSFFGRVYDSLFVRYRVYFPEGTEFVKGGKLPGFAGGDAPSGGQLPTGDSGSGFSARIMWRMNSSGSDSAHPYIVQYLYHQDMPSAFGDDLWWDYPTGNGLSFKDWTPQGKRWFETGKWHTVKTLVRMNTPGDSNGYVISWFDGDTALIRRGLRFRDAGVTNWGVDQFFFSTFYGGGNSTWAPLTDQKIYFDEFVISENDIVEDNGQTRAGKYTSRGYTTRGASLSLLVGTRNARMEGRRIYTVHGRKISAQASRNQTGIIVVRSPKMPLRVGD